MKLSKKRFMQGFFATVAVLALTRCIFPDVAKPRNISQASEGDTLRADTAAIADTTAIATPKPTKPTKFFNADGSLVKNRIYSVPSFKDAFPDSNSVQLASAQRWGVKEVANRQEAEAKKKELVYIGCSPYYYVDRLNNSVPYLVPHAAVLLNDIGRTFYDSLQVKGIPLHKIIVTSVLRTREDVNKLRSRNGNATENSCHLYGTTFDICYNRYKTVEDPDGPSRHKVRNDTLKWVLSEVLRDFRQNDRCYIKYEVKQGCFHMTVR